MIVVSGARIAREIGVSRSTVWRWVNRLRELGVRVKGQQHTGYFLEKVPDILTPDMLRQRLKGSLFGKRIYHFFKVDSTNRVALDLGHAGEPEGAVVVAEEQTAGRGRAGHSWHSERASGIYVTVLLRPRLVAGAGPAADDDGGTRGARGDSGADRRCSRFEVAERFIDRWEKVGGILTEMHAEPSQVRFVIVGIGIKCESGEISRTSWARSPLPCGRKPGECNRGWSCWCGCCENSRAATIDFLAEGASSLVERFAAISSYAHGKRVRVANGKESFTGVTAGLAPEGLLLVKQDTGVVVTVIAGDVTEASR